MIEYNRDTVTTPPDVKSASQPVDLAQSSWHPRGLVVLFLRFMVAGIGLGLGISLVVCGVYLYERRPKPWNTSAVTARPVRAYVGDEITLTVQYQLRNNTDRDIRVHLREPFGKHDWRILERGFRGLSPLPMGDHRLAESAADPAELFLPPGEDVALSVSALFLLSPLDPRDKVIGELRRVKFSGFVIYDPDNRLRIDLPFSERVLETK